MLLPLLLHSHSLKKSVISSRQAVLSARCLPLVRREGKQCCCAVGPMERAQPARRQGGSALSMRHTAKMVDIPGIYSSNSHLQIVTH